MPDACGQPEGPFYPSLVTPEVVWAVQKQAGGASAEAGSLLRGEHGSGKEMQY